MSLELSEERETMSQKHKVTLQKVFAHPMPTNIQWKKLMSALEHYEVAIEITHANKAKLAKDGQETLITLPHHDHEFNDKTEISHLKHFLESVGLSLDNL